MGRLFSTLSACLARFEKEDWIRALAERILLFCHSDDRGSAAAGTSAPIDVTPENPTTHSRLLPAKRNPPGDEPGVIRCKDNFIKRTSCFMANSFESRHQAFINGR